MSVPKELDEFRKKWRAELQQRRQEGKADDVPTTSSLKEDSPNSAPDKCVKHPLEDVIGAKRKNNTLQPFLIAETLLKGDDAKEYFISNSTSPRLGTSSSQDVECLGRPFMNLKKKRTQSPERTAVEFEEKDTEEQKERFLDIFLKDLNEINEIPFFDISLPREVAIKMFCFLDLVDLCRCAQVSVAWKSLSEDELLWCRVCHQLGYDQDIPAVNEINWKDRVRQHVLKSRQLHLNWKNRTGRFRQLEYVAGGVLTAADTWGSTIVAGYTNGHIKLWDLDDAYERLFTPSSRALVLDENNDSGTVSVYPQAVAVGDVYCAAGYTQGLVDLWSIEGDTAAAHSFDCHQPISGICLSPSEPTLAMSHGCHVTVASLNLDTQQFEKTDSIVFGSEVAHIKFVPKGTQTTRKSGTSLLAVAAGDQASIYNPGGDLGHVTDLHQVIGSSVSCIDCDTNYIAVGMAYYEMDELYKDKVKLYCLHTGKEMMELKGHTWTIQCINLGESPQHRLVTGSGDKRVRIYDLRLESPVLTLSGHATAITCAQMDDWKVVSGATDGLLCVWDQRMSAKLWDMHNRHPVRHLHFQKHALVTANIPHQNMAEVEDFDNMAHRRFRGSLHAYDFSTTQETEGVPSICLSTYDEPESYNYNIRLAVPYDKL